MSAKDPLSPSEKKKNAGVKKTKNQDLNSQLKYLWKHITNIVCKSHSYMGTNDSCWNNYIFLLKRQVLIIKGRGEGDMEELISAANLKNSFLIGHCFMNHAI